MADSSVRIKAKPAPAEITTAAQALEALDRLQEYWAAASYAYVQAGRYTGGTFTSTRHHRRSELYEIAADGWANVLRRWLEREVTP